MGGADGTLEPTARLPWHSGVPTGCFVRGVPEGQRTLLFHTVEGRQKAVNRQSVPVLFVPEMSAHIDSPEEGRTYLQVGAAKCGALLLAPQYHVQLVLAGGAAHAAVVRMDAYFVEQEESRVVRVARRHRRCCRLTGSSGVVILHDSRDYERGLGLWASPGTQSQHASLLQHQH